MAWNQNAKISTFLAKNELRQCHLARPMHAGYLVTLMQKLLHFSYNLLRNTVLFTAFKAHPLST